MPLFVEGGRVPPRGAQKANCRASGPARLSYSRAEIIRIGLINNMPDAALEDTELQFFDLLSSAAADIPVCVSLYSLPNVPRGDRGQHHLNEFYSPIEDLLESRLDGVIMTGTEPRQPDLRNEPYWGALTEVLDWGERNTTSTILSCLAAHAGVLYRDGIARHPLPDKRFGVFAYDRVSDHPLVTGSTDVLRFPHSRWNEVREEELSSCGYTIITRAENTGVDLFVRQTKSLFVHLQGHPEYGARTLLKEYRRDIRRFLRYERETYPSMPQGYFDHEASKLLGEFRENALARRHEELLTEFPEAAVSERLQNTWQVSASRLYSNWLQCIASKKADTTTFAAMVRTGQAARPQIAAG